MCISIGILYLIYTAIQKFGVSKVFFMVLKVVSYAHQGYIYLISNNINNIII